MIDEAVGAGPESLGALTSVGWIVGALLHRWALERLSRKTLFNLSILGGTAATLSFLKLHDAVTAAVVSFLSGVAAMVANIATLILAAAYCLKGSEGFTFAALMAVMNLAGPLSNNVGAADPGLQAATAFAFLLVPLLALGHRTHEKRAAATQAQ